MCLAHVRAKFQGIYPQNVVLYSTIPTFSDPGIPIDSVGVSMNGRSPKLVCQGLVNVPIKHHLTIGDINSNRYLKVMFKIPQKGHLPTPDYPTASSSFLK